MLKIIGGIILCLTVAVVIGIIIVGLGANAYSVVALYGANFTLQGVGVLTIISFGTPSLDTPTPGSSPQSANL